MLSYDTLTQLTHDRRAQRLREAYAERLYRETRATRWTTRRSTLRAERELAAARRQTA